MNEQTQTHGLISDTAARIGPSVVGLGRGWGHGSGVVSAEGRVLTNAHNLHGDHATVVFADGRRERAAVAGVDPDLDLAVLSAPTEGAAPVEARFDEEPPSIGAPVLALANPGGRGLRVTLGHVSSEAQAFRGPRGRPIAGAIEHTAPLPRGSSGGPLVDVSGRLLGINTLRRDGGLILAVPAGPAVRERIEALSRGEAPQTRRLGVALAPARASRRMRRAVGLPEREGLLVRAVDEGSPAARQGIERGDLIVAAGGEEVTNLDALYSALDALDGEAATLELTLVRGTEERRTTVSFDGAGDLREPV